MNTILEKFPKVKFIDHKLYQDKEFAKLIEEDPPGLTTALETNQLFISLNETTQQLLKLCNFPVLTKNQECYLFQQLNFFRRKANILREEILINPSPQTIDEFDRVNLKWIKIRNILLQCNIRLFVDFLRKKSVSISDILEKITDGSFIITKSIDKFDWSRGIKFSTYLTSSLLRSSGRIFFKSEKNQLVKGKHGKKIKSLIAINQEKIEDHQPCVEEQVDDSEETILLKLLNKVSQENKDYARCIKIIKAKKGIGCKPQKIIQIANEFKLSRERIRQLEKKGLDRLRKIAKEKYPDHCM